MALMAYNMLSVVLAAIHAAHGIEEAETISFYYMADEISGTYRGMVIALPPSYWTKQFADLTPSQLAKELVRIAKNLSPSKYRKNKWSPKKKKKKKGKITPRKHASTARILENRKTKAA